MSPTPAYHCSHCGMALQRPSFCPAFCSRFCTVEAMVPAVADAVFGKIPAWTLDPYTTDPLPPPGSRRYPRRVLERVPRVRR